MPHSKHEGHGADSVFCATATFDEETREHGVAMSFLGNKKERRAIDTKEFSRRIKTRLSRLDVRIL